MACTELSPLGPAVAWGDAESTTVVVPGVPPVTRAEATRRRLLDASLTVFARKGVHDTRVDDICAVAGVARATFYRHFDGKSEVFGALRTEMSADMLQTAQFLGPVGADADGLRTLREFIAGLLAMSEHWAPVISSLSAASAAGPEIRRESIELTDRFSREVGRRFVEGSVSGVSPTMGAVALAALVEGVGHQLKRWSLDVDRETVIDLLALEAILMLHPGLDLGELELPVGPA